MVVSLALFSGACGQRPGGTFIPDATDDAEASVIDLDGFVPDVRPVERDVVTDVQSTDAGSGCLTEELCTNGVDDDCDGMVDEGCLCVPGETQSCYRGTPRTRMVGTCADGRQACRGSGSEFGSWGPCEGGVVPAAEVCDTGLLDEDCDGTRNEDCECAVGAPPVACGSNVGACRPGTQACVDGHLAACTGATPPSPETCDGLDNDCDGMVDEGLVRACGSTMGVCRMGMQSCAAGSWGACSGGVEPSMELCDGLDNDCDGMVDEELARACGSNVGACRPGMQSCASGMWGMCTGATGPSNELCDGVDNDCDGIVDEGCGCRGGQTRPCGSNLGACRQGTETCSIMGVWGACMGATNPGVEECDGVDNDCDGVVDEGLVRTCGSNVGVCRTGTQFCAGGMWGACMGGMAAAPAEVCEGSLDENCNGAVDEGCGCTRGQTRACGSTMGVCRAGMQTCDSAGQWGMCMGSVGPSTELCDGVDNDCDGMTDEGCGCIGGQTRACGVGVGACRQGTETCSTTGVWGACMGSVGPSAELCDGVDNDCDAMTDEGCGCVQGQTRPCGSNVGACRQGTETCSATGSWGVCTGATNPGTEVCNRIDDNCDGTVDEGGVCPPQPPMVMCPAAMSTVLNSPVSLDANASDPDGPTLTLTWSVSTRPTGSSAAPMPTNTASTSFRPDVAGDYLLRFCARDPSNMQACCTVTVTAMAACSMPPAPAVSSTCGTSWDGRPIVEFTSGPVPSGLVYEVYQAGNPTALGTALAGHNYFRPPTRLLGGAPPPGAPVSLYVRACRASDPTCCANSNAINTNIVEECTTPVAASPTNVVFSEYVIDGDGSCTMSGPRCQAGEAIEITNLSHCPVTLDGAHFSYRSSGGSSGVAVRWMNFTAADVIPPRGVYVAMRYADLSMCDASLPAESTELFGFKMSQLMMEGSNLDTGWINNNAQSGSILRIATGTFPNPAMPSASSNFTSGTEIARISPYLVPTGSNTNCVGIGFNAVNGCGDVASGAVPTDTLRPNQLGRLWHPCDAVVNPNPASCR